MAYLITAAEYVDIDGLPLDTPAWTTSNASDLWSSPDLRGSDVIIPGALGVLAQPRRPTVTKATIELDIVGDTDPEGFPYTNTALGLTLNLAVLRALADPPATVDGTRTLTLHLPPGAATATRSGPAHVERIRLARDGRLHATGQIELSLPKGALT